jgi:two-component system nitrate/nitrite response regulator NarL
MSTPRRTPRAPIRALIVDDHPLYRAGVRRALELAGIAVIGEAADEAQALAMATASPPEVCLIDLRLGAGDGARLIEALRAAHPTVRPIALTAFDDPLTASRAERAGAVAFLSKDIGAGGLVAAVRSAVAEAPAAPLPTPTRGAGPTPRPLSPRQQAVLDGLAEGRSVREISEELGITARTVETYRAVLKRKLGVHSAAALRELVEERGRGGP